MTEVVAVQEIHVKTKKRGKGGKKEGVKKNKKKKKINNALDADSKV